MALVHHSKVVGLYFIFAECGILAAFLCVYEPYFEALSFKISYDALAFWS